MIKLFKIIKGIYNLACVPYLDFIEFSDDVIRTSSNKYNLVQHSITII